MKDKTIAKIISATEASNNFGSLIDEAAKGRSYFVVTRLGKARAVVLGIDQYGRLLEELEIKAEQNDAKFQRSLREARQDYKLGRVMNEKEFDKEFGFSKDMFSGEEQSQDG